MKIRDIVESTVIQEAPEPAILAFLKKIKLKTLVKGNNIEVLVDTPPKNKDAFRKEVLLTLLKSLKPAGAAYDPLGSSIGRIVFAGDPTKIYVKDIGKKGDNSAGIGNEKIIAEMLDKVIKNHGSANVTFVDDQKRKLTIKSVTQVDVSGRSSGTRKHGGEVKKADIVLRSLRGQLPVSIKKINAEYWESADTYYGAKAGALIKKLRQEGYIKLLKTDKPGILKLSKEIVVEPTEQEAQHVIFGGDINPEGGVIIQTFLPEHFVQDGNKVTIHAHAVIKTKEDIPESHLMMWLIRNDSSRNIAAIGIPGVRVYAAAYKRAIGGGDKNIVLVNAKGKVV
jgi:hypothetical protein